MTINVSKVESSTKATVRVHLDGTPDLKGDYVNRHMQPYFVSIEYTYRQHQDGQWTTHEWAATSVKVVGSRILKPRPDGTQRLGMDTHDATWQSSGNTDVQQDERKPLPEWLDRLVSDLRPSGDLTLVRVQ